jgi:hypothetical protein
MLMIVATNLLSVLSCQYDQNGRGFLLADPTTVCWEGDHKSKAAVSLLFLAYYLPLSTLVSPMLTEVSEKGDKSKDILFRTSFLMALGVLKTSFFIVPLFFEYSEASQLVTAFITDLLSFLLIILWTFYHSNSKYKETFLAEPCNIAVINVIRSLPFLGGALHSIGQLVGLGAWLVFLIIPGVAVALLIGIIYQRKSKALPSFHSDEEYKPTDEEKAVELKQEK